MAAELSPDPCWQGGDSNPDPNLNPSHALQWLLRGQHSQCVGHCGRAGRGMLPPAQVPRGCRCQGGPIHPACHPTGIPGLS